MQLRAFEQQQLVTVVSGLTWPPNCELCRIEDELEGLVFEKTLKQIQHGQVKNTCTEFHRIFSAEFPDKWEPVNH